MAQRFLFLENTFLGFHRLSIMDLSSLGQQPFQLEDKFLLCNGEIYNQLKLKESLTYDFVSESDCEVLLPYFKKHGLKKLMSDLDGEYASSSMMRKQIT
jgi:asparagine synthase (glutamine-hydrolysing)